ncbi:MAG: hypothetical protein GXP08_17290 [Gammaproteobacteria bacterium]|nr:hypothetical protein [Gammaproteobacteria bacterium]
MKKHYKYSTILLILLLPVSLTAFADIYPGDTIYSNIVQEIYHDVSADTISLSFNDSISNRTELCANLTSRHNSQTNPGQNLTNAAFIGVPVSMNDCLMALWFSAGYSSAAGWNFWAGDHSGFWYDENQIFSDSAYWQTPVEDLANNPNDVDASGNRRIYVAQPVQFLERGGGARYGWNQSISGVSYVWGWDPKDNQNQNGTTGAHVGWTLTSGTANCIVWVTKNEAFLECIKLVGPTKRRTSTGFFGFGQWEITN